MFFERELISFRILDVVELKQGQVSRNVRGRQFDALSFRLHADVWLGDGTHTLHATDDTVSFVPAGLDYTRSGPCDELIAVHFHLSDVMEKRMEIIQPSNAAAVRELFIRLLQCWKAKEKGYQYRCSALLYEILALCSRETAQEEKGRLQPSMDYLSQHWNDPELTIGTLAEKSFMSEVYFRKLFRQRFGLSPQKYLVQMRIQNAADLMHTGYYSLKEVAALCGYRDYKYFSVEFRRIKGCPPSEYQYSFE